MLYINQKAQRDGQNIHEIFTHQRIKPKTYKPSFLGLTQILIVLIWQKCVCIYFPAIITLIFESSGQCLDVEIFCFSSACVDTTRFHHFQYNMEDLRSFVRFIIGNFTHKSMRGRIRWKEIPQPENLPPTTVSNLP